MTRRKLMTVDVTDYMRKVCEGAGIPYDGERYVLPVSMWRKMVKLLRLDDYIQDEETGDADRRDDTAA